MRSLRLHTYTNYEKEWWESSRSRLGAVGRPRCRGRAAERNVLRCRPAKMAAAPAGRGLRRAAPGRRAHRRGCRRHLRGTERRGAREGSALSPLTAGGRRAEPCRTQPSPSEPCRTLPNPAEPLVQTELARRAGLCACVAVERSQGRRRRSPEGARGGAPRPAAPFSAPLSPSSSSSSSSVPRLSLGLAASR